MTDLVHQASTSLARSGVRFTKMHGLGNDFVVIDRRQQAFEPDADAVRRMADRHTGVGFDQLLILDPPSAGGDLGFGIFNADGESAEQCGNGLRCVARLFFETSAKRKRDLIMESPAGRIQARVLEDGNVSVDMGEPDFDPRALPFEVDGEADSYTLAAACQEVVFGAVSMGNPHVVVPVPDISTAEVERIGSAIAAHGAFPRSTNVGFMEIVDIARIRLRVRERGVGETLACGTGASAAAAVARRWGKVDREVIVELPGGELEIQWDGPGHHLWMTGPAVRVYEGIISL
jgi:diaminopimelate epimerase